MKFFLALFLFLLALNAHAFPPVGVSGQNQSNKYPAVLKVPNNLATDIGAATSLLESGNNNLLANPSFEHSSATTSWTTGGTASVAASTSTKIHGAKALCFTASSQTFTLTQDSTLYASEFSGGAISGAVSINVNTNHSGTVTVCPRSAGANLTSCITVESVQKNSEWYTHKIPVVLGGTSNGISIEGASGTGTTCVDASFVGQADVEEDVANIGPWTAYTPTFTGFGTVSAIEGEYRQVGSDLQLRVKFTAGTSTATEARISLPSGYVSAGTSIIPSINHVGASTRTAASSEYVTALIEPSVSYITFGLQSASAGGLNKANGSAIISSGQSMSVFASVPVVGLDASVQSYSTSCGTDVQCTNEFSAKVSSTGVVSDENLDWINGNCTFTSGKAVCTPNTGIFAVTPNCTASAANSDSKYATMNPVSTSTAIKVATADGATNTNIDFIVKCQKQGADFKARRNIVGTFAEHVKTPGVAKVSLCSAKVSSTGVLSDQRGGCFSSCTNATTPVCTFTTNYWVGTPNCWHRITTSGLVSSAATTTTTFSGRILNTAFSDVSGDREYFCHGEAL